MFSTTPFKSIMDLLQAFPTEESCIVHLEKLRWNGKVESPFCTGSFVYNCPNHRYKCKDTNKYFNVRAGTIFEGTKIPLRQWFLGIYLVATHKKGISSHQLAKDLNITQKTAWFMLQRIRYAMEHESFLAYMGGVVQIDETFVGGKNKNRHRDKKVPQSQGRSFKDKTPIVGLLNSDTKILRCVVVDDTSRKSLHPVINATIKTGSIIVTDEWMGYNGLEKKYERQIVDHKRQQYLNDGGFTTNSVEGAWSHLKRTIIGTYHKISRKHLQQYANEFTFRFNFRNETTSDRFNLLLQSVKGKRLTYKNLIS